VLGVALFVLHQLQVKMLNRALFRPAKARCVQIYAVAAIGVTASPFCFSVTFL
jgi:hypothetical protein